MNDPLYPNAYLGSEPQMMREPRTVGQRWRFRRNLVIFAAHHIGFSQRILADVFDLPRSRVSAIIKEIEALEDAWKKGEAETGMGARTLNRLRFIRKPSRRSL